MANLCIVLPVNATLTGATQQALFKRGANVKINYNDRICSLFGMHSFILYTSGTTDKNVMYLVMFVNFG